MSTVTTAQLTSEFVEALINWQEQGSRSIKIELSKQDLQDEAQLVVWVYDYNLVSGNFVNSPEEIPSDRDLLLKQQKDIEASQRRLNDQLQALEV